MAVAPTTRISKGYSPLLRWSADQSIGTWYGREIPPGVTHIEEWMDAMKYQQWVGWKTRDGQTHSMPVDVRNIDAVIIAMKLTC